MIKKAKNLSTRPIVNVVCECTLGTKILSDQHQLKGIFFNRALQKLSQKTLLIQDPDFTHSAYNFFVNHKIQFTLNLLCLVAFFCFFRENFCIFPKCILKCKVKFTYNPSINVTVNAVKTCNSEL